MEEMNQMGQPQEPSSGIKKYVITFIILLIIIGGIYWIIRSSIDIGKTLPAAADSSSVQIIINHKDAPADWKQYTNEEYAVEMSYPDIFTQETADIDLPSMKTKIVGTRLVHTVDKENCVDRSDPKTCTPKTEDIAVGLFFLKKNFVDFRNLLLAQTPDARLQGVTFDGHEGFMLAVDKEGKGIYQFFFPILNGRAVLLVTRAYVNEQVATIYQSVTGFIPFENQTATFSQMVQSIKLGQ